MTLRIIEISAPADSADKIKELAEHYEAIDCWHHSGKTWFSKKDDTRETTRILIDVGNQQDLLDALTRAVNKNEGWRILLIPVEASLPAHEETDKTKTTNQNNGNGGWFSQFKIRDMLRGSVTREELLGDMERGARMSFDRMLLIFLSAVVAGIGLIQDDVAVIIGAMVIAPLLGPNLSLSFAAALGNKTLLTKAAITNIISLVFVLALSALAGFLLDPTTITESSGTHEQNQY